MREPYETRLPVHNPVNGHRHRDAEAMGRCWGCSHPEMLEVTEADRERARQLIAEGYKSTSTKYRRVSRLTLPPFDQLVTVSPDAPVWLRERLRDAYTYQANYGHREHGEHLTLTVGEFRAFKQLGGPLG